MSCSIFNPPLPELSRIHTKISDSRASKVFPSPHPSIPIKTDIHVKLAHCAFMQINCRLFPLCHPFRSVAASVAPGRGSGGIWRIWNPGPDSSGPKPKTPPDRRECDGTGLPLPDCFIKVSAASPVTIVVCCVRCSCCCCDLCKLICL